MKFFSYRYMDFNMKQLKYMHSTYYDINILIYPEKNYRCHNNSILKRYLHCMGKQRQKASNSESSRVLAVVTIKQKNVSENVCILD